MLRYLKATLIAALLCASTVAHGACWQWSRTTSANASADPTINWSVGISPSSVDASGRAMMARTAECRDDYSGLLVTGGTSTAYSVTTYQGLAATPNDGQLLGITIGTTNAAGVTLAADGGTAYPIQSSAGAGVSNGVLIAGSPYTVKFSTANSAWMLRDFYGNPFSIPIGAMLPYTGATAPNSNFVLPAGQCISRTTYATYFAQVSTTFGTCDGTTTFGVPDMRGRVIAALDNLNGSAASRLTTTYYGTDPTVLGNVGGSQNHTLIASELPVSGYSSAVTDPGHTHLETASVTGSGSNNGISLANVQTPSNTVFPTASATTGISVSTTVPGGGNAHAIVQPTIVLSYILRVL